MKHAKPSTRTAGRSWLPMACCCGLLALPLAARAAGPDLAPLDVRFEPSTTKVLKGPVPDNPARSVTIEAARNEYVAFQVVLTATGGPVTEVTVALTDLSGPDGAVIPSLEATLYREYYVEITEPSWCETPMSPACESFPEYLRKPGWYPDALIPFVDPYPVFDGPGNAPVPVGAPFEVPGQDLQTVFVDLHVPESSPPGDYTGQVIVTSQEGERARLPVTLHVWDFVLPRERSITTAYGFGTGQLWKYHGGPDGGDEATRDRIRRNYEIEMHRHRIDFTNQDAPLRFEFDDQGRLLPPDFTAYDAWLGPRIDGSYYPDGAGIRRFDLDWFRPGSGLGSWTEDQWTQAAVALAEHLRDKGWLDHVYLYSSDEPWMPEHLAGGAIQRIHEDVRRLRAASSLYQGKVMVTGPRWPDLDGDIDIWCPVTAMYGDAYWPAGVWWGREEYRERHLARGGELWFYVCNANFPALMGYDVDTDIGHEPRLLKWGAWREQASGFLYWRLTYWQDPDPWHDLANVEVFGPDFARNGDGILIYPGDANGTLGTGLPLPWRGIDGPVVSFRLKQIRDGLEDWEILRMAEALGGGDYARAQVDLVYRKFGAPLDDSFDRGNRPWEMDDGPVLAARARIAAKVQYLQHPDRYPDPEEPQVADPADPADEGSADDAGDPGPDIPQAEEVPSDSGAPADLADSRDGQVPDPGSGDADSGSGDPGTRSSRGGCHAGPRPPEAPWMLWLLLLAAVPRTPARPR